MGIRGLTTFVEKHSDQLFETYKLRDGPLVIDGNSLASQLYQCVCKANSAFGGDYDSYADCVRQFFNILRKCNVTPVILIDGGHEVKKLTTVKARFQTRICDARKVNPVVQMKRSIFPIFLDVVFKDVLREMGIKFVQCGFEADHEIAAVARALNCPVLSYDSDFYIYDVLYIPFDTLLLEAVEVEGPLCGGKCFAVDCKVYKVDRFLSLFGDLDKAVLPLMATVLGNDYIQKKVFHNFFSKIKHPKSRTSSDTQRHIVGLLTWLKGKTRNEAINMILSCIKQCDQQCVLAQLNKSIHCYSRSSTVLTLLCHDATSLPNIRAHLIVGDSEVDRVDMADREFEMCPQDQPGKSSANPWDKLTAEENIFDALPQWFRDNFHKGLLPPSMLDMITLHTYFCQPQVEDYSLPHSHELSLNILPVIFRLLTSHEAEGAKLTVIFRSKNAELQKVALNAVELVPGLDPLPRLDDLPDVPLAIRASVILGMVGLDEKARLLLEEVPDAWRIFVIAIVFWARHTKHVRSSLPALISAILLVAVSLKVVDGVVGYFRTRKNFLKCHGSKVKKILRTENQLLLDENSKDVPDKTSNGAVFQEDASVKNSELSCYNENATISSALINVSEADCFHFAKTFILFRYLDENMKHNRKLYNVTVVHALAQFQSCLFHLMCLNAVLNFPYEQTKVSSFFSGTAVYNLYANFQKRTNLSLYVAQLAGQSPTILTLFFALKNVITSFLPDIFLQDKVGKKHRKKRLSKRKNMKNDEPEELINEVCDENEFVDENNKFSVLSRM